MDVMALRITLFLTFYDQKQQQLREQTFELGATLAQISREFRWDKSK
jgi:hypothetical protein